MKKFFALTLLLFAYFQLWGANTDLFALAGKSYIQRGVLTIDGNETALTAYVVVEGEKIKVLLKTQAGKLAKVELNRNGSVNEIEAGAYFPLSFVEKYILRDVRVALGFLQQLSTPSYLELEDGALKSVVCDDYKMEFLNYACIDCWCEKIPQTLKVYASNYGLELQFVSPIKQK